MKTPIEKIRKVRAFIQELGFSFRTEGKDSMLPMIIGAELYDMVMDAESCQALIDKLREYKLKAFK